MTISLTVGQAATTLGVTPRAIRFWDRKGLARPTRTGPGGRRYYEGDDLTRLTLVAYLRRCRWTIEEVRRAVELRDRGETAAMKALAEDVRRRLRRESRAIRDAVDGTASFIANLEAAQ